MHGKHRTNAVHLTLHTLLHQQEISRYTFVFFIDYNQFIYYIVRLGLYCVLGFRCLTIMLLCDCQSYYYYYKLRYIIPHYNTFC